LGVLNLVMTVGVICLCGFRKNKLVHFIVLVMDSLHCGVMI
jgi:hypothetical protein